MKRFYYFLILYSLLFSLNENSYSQDISSEIQLLENDLRDFNYQKVLNKGRFLLSESDITQKDSLKIYEYILNAAYSLNDTLTAKNIAEKIVKCSYNFNPDPRITSPKIIRFFNSVKEKMVQPLTGKKIPGSNEQTSNPISFEPLPSKYLLTSLFFPGSSHLLKGHKKGYYFASISSVLIGGIVYSSIKTVNAREDYMQAKTGTNFDQLYDKYNSAYNIRNGLIVGYLLFNLYTLYDFYSNEVKNKAISLNVIQNQNSYSLQFSYAW